MYTLKSRVQHLRRLHGHAVSHTRFALAQSPRYVHQSSQRNVSLPTSPPVHTPSPLLPTQPDPWPAHSVSLLRRLPTSTVLRSYLITRMSSSPLLLSLCFILLRRILDSKSALTSIERNPVLAQLLKKTFYAQFCVGETTDEVVRNTDYARGTLGYDGILFEYALEVLGGAEPTAAETAAEIETWRRGIMLSVGMAQQGDFVGLKWSGLGRHALRLLQTRQPATPAMWAAITSACDLAASKGVSLLPGAEEEATNPGLEAWTLALQKKYNTDRAVVYTTYQCYLRAIAGRLSQHLELASREGYVAGVKLVRGAYLTSESGDVVFDSKAGTDTMYDSCAEAVVARKWTDTVNPTTPNVPFPAVDVVLATHNSRSIDAAKAIRATQLATAQAPQSLPRLTYAQLQGMADEISQALVQDKIIKGDERAAVVKCMTWGTTRECLNFLLRRASENKEAAGRTEETRRAMGKELWRRAGSLLGLAA